MRLETITGEWMSSTALDDVRDNAELHAEPGASRRRGVFSGIINLLTLSGSLLCAGLRSRDPRPQSRHLLGLSLIVLLAYLMQGYFDRLRARNATRIAASSTPSATHVHHAHATLHYRRKAMLAQQPIAT